MSHPDAEVLDQYALHLLTDEAEIASIEEHLLVCEECRQGVLLTDEIRSVGYRVPQTIEIQKAYAEGWYMLFRAPLRSETLALLPVLPEPVRQHVISCFSDLRPNEERVIGVEADSYKVKIEST